MDLSFTSLRLNRASAAGNEGTVSPGYVGAPLPALLVQHPLQTLVALRQHHEGSCEGRTYQDLRYNLRAKTEQTTNKAHHKLNPSLMGGEKMICELPGGF